MATVVTVGSKLDDLQRVHPKTRTAWRKWLRDHHATSDGVWFVNFKKATGKPRLEYDETVQELLCFGWVDSLTRALDEERSMLLCTPRKPKSLWSRPNKQRVARMEQAGLMTEAGRAMVELARRSGTWTALDDVENLVVPDDLAAAFRAHPGSAEYFDAFPRSVKRGILEWILQAKRTDTRAKRIEQTASKAARNERANQWKK